MTWKTFGVEEREEVGDDEFADADAEEEDFPW